MIPLKPIRESNSLKLPRVIGHRGASHYAPENTLSALRKAHELGISWVEFDVTLTGDSHPVVIHDLNLDRTTNGFGVINRTSLAQIRKLDAGSWFNPTFAGEKIPTLVEYLQTAQQLGLGINLEIKPGENQERETAQAVLETLQQHWQNGQLLVSSFSILTLRALRSLDAHVPIGLLLDHWCGDWQEMIRELHCFSLHAKYRLLTPQRIHQIKEMGCRVLAYTVDDVQVAQKLFSKGVDAVFSNVPDKILAGVKHN